MQKIPDVAAAVRRGLRSAPGVAALCDAIRRAPRWAMFGAPSQIVARLLPTLAPPVLLLSLPRSGSSWIGNTLGLSPSALYLREPLTQTYLDQNPFASPVFEVNNETATNIYVASARRAFAALPAFRDGIVIFPSRWSHLRERGKRRLVVKEVNPLAAGWLVEMYRPRVIYLLRHPAAIADSYQRLGWLAAKSKQTLEHRFSEPSLAAVGFEAGRFSDSMWAQHAAFQAITLRLTAAALEGYADFKLVMYEDLCLRPLDAFRELYSFAGLAWSAEVERAIAQGTSVRNHNRNSAYSLERNSKRMPHAWRENLTHDQLAELKAGYLALNPPYYKADEW